jgi:hypothetical protein
VVLIRDRLNSAVSRSIWGDPLGWLSASTVYTLPRTTTTGEYTTAAAVAARTKNAMGRIRLMDV